jgi:hypothetical protein
LPQPPQLKLSVCVLTHVGLPASTPHMTPSPGQTPVHLPPTHACGEGHTLLHEPQLSLSVDVFTQTVPHAVSPALQLGMFDVVAFAQLATIATAPSNTVIAARRAMSPSEQHSMLRWWTMRSLAVAFGAAFALVVLAVACDNSSTPTCAATQTSCEGTCVDTMNNPANCGACGTTCDTTSICSHGTCVQLCTNGQQACAVGDGGICTSTQSDNQHCGSCDTPCKPLEVCTAGKCGGGCPPSEIGCIPEAGQPYCASSQTDNANCGACGVTCGPQEVCNAGQCASNCQTGQTLCTPDGGPYYCARTATDNANCGSCGNACGPLEVCAGGKCAASCLSTHTECNLPNGDGGSDGGAPYCADLKNDNSNCGACGNACPSAKPLCSAGICVSLG